MRILRGSPFCITKPDLQAGARKSEVPAQGDFYLFFPPKDGSDFGGEGVFLGWATPNSHFAYS